MKLKVLVAIAMATTSFGWTQTLSTKDGLRISFAPDGTVQQVQVARKSFFAPGGFLIAEPTELGKLRWMPIRGKTERKGDALILQLSNVNFELTATFAERPDAIFCEGTIRNLTNSDRVVVLAFSLPIDATKWLWWENLRNSRQ
ncbi:MAG: hypothetical protein N3B10_15165, partial [Armatimonadetes bacterium]|nr:hypothetical protein [Armatimonadota bacterium]